MTPNYNMAACTQYKKYLDSMETELDRAIPQIKTDLLIGVPTLPERVEIDSGTQGMGGWAGGGRSSRHDGLTAAASDVHLDISVVQLGHLENP